MAVSRHFVSIFLLAFCCVDALEGRFMTSFHDHFLVHGDPAPEKPVAEKLADPTTAPKKANETKYEIAEKSTDPIEAPNKAEEKKFEHQYDPKAKDNDKAKYPVIMAMHAKLAVLFGKTVETWWMDWKLWVGLTFWIAAWSKWLTRGHDEIYWQGSLFVFGVNIMILHVLQYAPSIKIGMLIVCLFVCAQSLLQSYIKFEAEKGDDEDSMEEFNADTLYLDLMLPFEQIIILFIAQLGVWWFYMTSILGNFSFDHVNYLFWFWAYMAIQITMIFNRGDDSALGNPFPVHDVYRLMKKTDQVTFALEDSDEKDGGQFTKSKADILARGLMGYLCNCILRDIMAYTIPLMLMGFSEPMDFVVYCVGVNFICTLDDMSDRKYLMTGRETTDAEAPTEPALSPLSL